VLLKLEPSLSAMHQGELRPFGTCAFVNDYSFGMLDFDWEQRVLKMQLLAGMALTNGPRQNLSVEMPA
jgi:hypothetical protein